jgi:hypothetical protein
MKGGFAVCCNTQFVIQAKQQLLINAPWCCSTIWLDHDEGAIAPPVRSSATQLVGGRMGAMFLLASPADSNFTVQQVV